ncbi:MAG: molybdenum cofactor biosynthesis protein [Acidimicrobiales bacterium]|nr:MAG: molybdenum cofactor biosynthesis protein [Acidimicrobiales bacterium]
MGANVSNTQPRTGRVIISSTRAASGEYADTTGPLIVEWLKARGIATPAPVVVRDGVQTVSAALREAISAQVDIVITSGGTGLSPDDQTPEATAPLLERPVPGIISEIRRRGTAAGVASAILTRGSAGVVGNCFVVNFPGSVGGVRDGLSVLDGVLEHMLAQIAGSGHHG